MSSNLPERVTGSPFDALKLTDGPDERWSARDLQPHLGYSVWRDFANAIDRAKAACANSGADSAHHFADARKVTGSGPAAADVHLTRYGAYLVAMNGDPRKPEIARAQTYFAAKTREAEARDADLLADPLEALEAANLRMTQALALVRAERDARQQAERNAEALAAPAAAWDHLASGDGDWSVADAAKILARDPAIKTGQGRLFRTLKDWGWIYRAGDRGWRAKQTQVDCGRMSEIPQSHYHPRTGELVLDPPQVRIKPKGLVEIHRRLGGSKPLAVEQQLTIEAA